MNKNQIKEFGKELIREGHLSADEFKSHARKFLTLRQNDRNLSFTTYLMQQEVLTQEQVDQLLPGSTQDASAAPERPDPDAPAEEQASTDGREPAGNASEPPRKGPSSSPSRRSPSRTRNQTDRPEGPSRKRSGPGGSDDSQRVTTRGSHDGNTDRDRSSSSTFTVRSIIAVGVLLTGAAAGLFVYLNADEGEKKTATAPANVAENTDETGADAVTPADDASDDRRDTPSSSFNNDTDVTTSGEESRSTADVSAPDAAEGEANRLTFQKRIHRPDPAPELPEAFDGFNPPAPTVDGKKLGVSSWTKTADPDEIVVIGGHGFADAGGAGFTIYTQSGGEAYQETVDPFVREEYKASVTLPAEMPENGLYLAYPTTSEGRGTPALINHAEVWYSLPQHRTTPGQTVSVYGRNLSHNHGEKKSWVYLKPKGKKVIGTWAEVTQVNPYRVQFRIPKSFEPGTTYEVWVHNGHGGAYGWHPLHSDAGGHISNSYLNVNAPRKWDGPRIDVTDLGATPDDGNPDDGAIKKAVKKANNTKNTTLYFPAGTYIVDNTVGPLKGPNRSGMRVVGDGMDETVIAGVTEDPPGTTVKEGANHIEFRDLELRYRKKPSDSRDKAWRHVLESVGGWDASTGLRIINTRIDGRQQTAINLPKQDHVTIRGSEILNGHQLLVMVQNRWLVEHTDFYANSRTEILMYPKGAYNLSVRHCRGLNLHEDAPSSSRFWTFTTYGNRVENMYFGNNETKNLMPPEGGHQNVGEQFMWEGIGVIDQQQPERVEGDRFYLKDGLHHDKKVDWYHTVLVTAGRGLGQYRLLGHGKEHDNPKEWDAHPGWDVQPSTESTLSFPWSVNRTVFYGNKIDARPRAANSEAHVASAGIQPWGSSIEVVIDNNTFTELRAGINLTSFNDERRAPTPTFFHLIQDNTFETIRWGIMGSSSAGKKQKADLPGPSTLGVIIRDNNFKDIKKKGIKWGVNGREGVRVFDMVHFKNNTFEGMPLGIKFGDGGEPSSSYGALGLIDNVLRRGDGEKSGSIGLHLFTKERLIEENNEIKGFETPIKFGE